MATWWVNFRDASDQFSGGALVDETSEVAAMAAATALPGIPHGASATSSNPYSPLVDALTDATHRGRFLVPAEVRALVSLIEQTVHPPPPRG